MCDVLAACACAHSPLRAAATTGTPAYLGCERLSHTRRFSGPQIRPRQYLIALSTQSRAAIQKRILPYCLTHYVNMGVTLRIHTVNSEGVRCEGDGSR